MIVNVEFLDENPIENVITSLNYKVDKTIFFGYKDDPYSEVNHSGRFLEKFCGVKDVEFYGLSKTNLEENIVVMQEVLQSEIDGGHQVFVDVTGGESIVLLAFGILANKMNLPIHMYDVKKNMLYEMNREVGRTLSGEVQRHHVKLNIDRYIELHGGIINYAMQKADKSIKDSESEAEAKMLWRLCSKHRRSWNTFSEFLRDYCQPDENLVAVLDLAKIKKEIRGRQRFTNGKMADLFNDCIGSGVFMDARSISNNRYTFRYKNERILGHLWDAGSVLEMHTYSLYEEKADDCRVGVHVDWDGVIRGGKNLDTVNEIDVMVLNGFNPTFISCKNGNVDRTALYELDTVAQRFGGKYVKKVLVVTQTVNKSVYSRAKEMDIEIIKA